MEYQGEGKYRFVYYVNRKGGKWEPIFSVTTFLPVGGIGMFREEVSLNRPYPDASRENAIQMARAFVVPEDLGTPPGALSLRGAWKFLTPPNWDACTRDLRHDQRPVAPMMVVRVETDWFPHETEFRYVLQPGEGISGSHSMPIGQVLFVPREDITLVTCSDEETEAIRQKREEFFREKDATKPRPPTACRTARSIRAGAGRKGNARHGSLAASLRRAPKDCRLRSVSSGPPATL